MGGRGSGIEWGGGGGGGGSRRCVEAVVLHGAHKLPVEVCILVSKNVFC